MAWFEQSYHFATPRLTLAHFTDSHLFATRDGKYFAENTALNLMATLAQLSFENVDCVIFGGDLTQDHSFESYRLFAELVEQSPLNCPVFWVPGNHDDIAWLEEISQGQIRNEKRLNGPFGQVLLVNSKGETPAGWCQWSHLRELAQYLDEPSLVFCHHHPKAIDGYLDKHMLENGPQLLNTLVNSNQVQALIHGHVHHEYELIFRNLPIYATPATSVQFAKHTEDWQQQRAGPAFRLVTLTKDSFSTTVKWLKK
ncbi:metallophosphoesterase family protein [Pseudoalteromonas sp. T1lg65]|uniref:metallophosphoesterase family protein n=1 Tax=Pseudoalteromonas sp. T1lg65 TaxID=2077101 RepID=UPI003F79ED2F